MALGLTIFASGICSSTAAHADDEDEVDVEITYDWEGDSDFEGEAQPEYDGYYDFGGGCGECTPGDRRCWDNWSDQICGLDGNGCGVWYHNSDCEDPYICNYAQCGD